MPAGLELGCQLGGVGLDEAATPAAHRAVRFLRLKRPAQFLTDLEILGNRNPTAQVALRQGVRFCPVDYRESANRMRSRDLA